jgi:hypothetical protein
MRNVEACAVHGCALAVHVRWAYSLLMTPRFKRILEAAFWFVLGFLTHLLLHHYHSVPR